MLPSALSAGGAAPGVTRILTRVHAAGGSGGATGASAIRRGLAQLELAIAARGSQHCEYHERADKLHPYKA